MACLIDKDAAVAEIERRRNICKKVILDLRSHESKVYYQGKAEAYKDILDTLDTLKAKDVDLDASVERYIEQHKTEFKGYFDIRRIAKHFFELGLKV